jgi:hypothetical protein
MIDWFLELGCHLKVGPTTQRIRLDSSNSMKLQFIFARYEFKKPISWRSNKHYMLHNPQNCKTTLNKFFILHSKMLECLHWSMGFCYSSPYLIALIFSSYWRHYILDHFLDSTTSFTRLYIISWNMIHQI